jgi:FAD/FMN-containing dehydrogenase
MTMHNNLQMYSENKLDYVMYGHAADGNLHTRPLIDLRSQSESQLMERLANQVFQSHKTWRNHYRQKTWRWIG